MLAPIASASQLIDRNATSVSLRVNAKGEAMITYRVAGKIKHVLAGRSQCEAAQRVVPQVKFNLDYSGGYGKYHRTTYWLVFNGSCLPYDLTCAVVGGCGMQGAGRLVLGVAVVAARAPRLRDQADRGAGGMGVATLALDR